MSERVDTRGYKDLLAWRKAMELAKDVYLLTQGYPKAELYGMTGQMRRAATSIPANIAEGNGRGSRKDYQQFLRIAKGSLHELETFLLLSEQIGFASAEQIQPMLQQTEVVSRLLYRLIESLNTTDTRISEFQEGYETD